MGNFSEYRDRDTLLAAAAGETTVAVWIYDRSAWDAPPPHDHWFMERHRVDDRLSTTVQDALEIYDSTYALWKSGDEWVLATRQGSVLFERRLPNREAAEMVAIHGG